MKHYIPSIFFLLSGLVAANTSIAQSNNTLKQTGEVIMTKAELEAFLTSIAKKKKENLNKSTSSNKYYFESPSKTANAQLNTLNIIKDSLTLYAPQNDDAYNVGIQDDRTIRELDRINSRIDMLILSLMDQAAQRSDNRTISSTHTNVQNRSYVLDSMYRKNEQLQRNVATLQHQVRQQNDAIQNGAYVVTNSQNEQLQQQIEALQQQVKLQNEALKSGMTINTNSENELLRKQIEVLQNQVKQQNSATGIVSNQNASAKNIQLQRQIDNLNQQLVQKNGTVAYSSNDNSEMARMQRQMDALSKELQLVKQQNNTASNHRFNSSNNSNSNASENARLQSQINALETSLRDVGKKQTTSNVLSGVNPVVSVASDAILLGQINKLKEEVRVLSQLSTTLKSNDYDSEISGLQDKIKMLTEEVAAGKAAAEANAKITAKNDDAMQMLRGQLFKVYFANAATKVADADIATIQEVANIAKENQSNVTVMVRGFASNRGSAQVNNKISLSRAESVRKILLAEGLSARNIQILHHGIDDTKSEAEARRVELSFMVH